MSPADQTLVTEPSGTVPAAVVAQLVRELADVLGVKPEQIDPGQPFRSLGLGSVPAVRFVSLVNRRYGTCLEATALLEHPTPLAFAALVAREARAQDRGVGERNAGAKKRVTGQGGPGAREVLDVLRERLADILGCESAALDPSAPFELLGVDSIRRAKFAAAVNDVFGTDERVGTLFEHPNLLAMAARVADVATEEKQPAAGQSAAEEVGALLDAVREDRLSVDEALTRLPRWM
ncbi:phosphopantetheine-binding protein [Streptomyces salinarius]|uniref:phosphopantetheine-binding protein n=1 Tax=Streptomyces salinarius TaxID=2762598 RepID=UPI0013DA89FE|nr:phosphopantetheine-binding protein [Streptomyces salinarius]